ncbi:MAG TPA: cytochrome bc complex cytochrome b subunit [Mycobacteriales bacterium]|nr:cytochrome bc complex cytochrome b subunit [Mycobacteriales bacterium]
MTSPAETATRKTLRVVDDRFGSANFLRRNLNKVFPDHWSFMLGEIALYSFVILLLTGTYLSLFFRASSQEVFYNGSYAPLRGLKMSEAYASTLHISFDVRAGLIIRQIHHWAALIFVSAIFVHLMRVYFTGAYRKPREINWLIGVGLLTLAILEGFAGYSLPDDLLSGTGIRIAYSVLESIPLVGTWLAFFVFGGAFPGQDFIPRLYIAHILLVPGLLLALITAHMMILWHQKHTDFAGPDKTEHNVIGSTIWPGFAWKTQGFLFLVFGVSALLGGFAQINPIWLYGPYNPAVVSAGSQPDWYIGFLEGSLRLMPNIEWNLFGHTIDLNVLFPGIILPGIMFTLLGLIPWLERWKTKDHAYHNVLDRPRNKANRTAAGVLAIVFYLVLLVGGGNDVLAKTFDWSLQGTTWALRVLIIVLPLLSFYVTKRICLGLQHSDADLLHHGIESGIIVRLPSGAFIEPTKPLPAHRRPLLESGPAGHAEPAIPYGHAAPNGHAQPAVGTGAQADPADGGALSAAGRAIKDFFTEPASGPESPEDPGQP